MLFNSEILCGWLKVGLMLQPNWVTMSFQKKIEWSVYENTYEQSAFHRSCPQNAT